MEGKEQEENYEENDILDNDNYEEDSDEGDDSYSGDLDFGGSEPAPLGGIYGLFQKVLNRKDSKKIANINEAELGPCNFSVRDCERIALIADTFNHPGVAKYFRSQSRIVLDTSMSRKGWFTELFVTSKSFASRESSSHIPNISNSNKSSHKWKIFSSGAQQQNEEREQQ